MSTPIPQIRHLQPEEVQSHYDRQSPGPVSPHTEAAIEAVASGRALISVKIQNVNMPFMDMVLFMVKVAFASIPAMIIVSVAVFFTLAFLAAIGLGGLSGALRR